MVRGDVGWLGAVGEVGQQQGGRSVGWEGRGGVGGAGWEGRGGVGGEGWRLCVAPPEAAWPRVAMGGCARLPAE